MFGLDKVQCLHQNNVVLSGKLTILISLTYIKLSHHEIEVSSFPGRGCSVLRVGSGGTKKTKRFIDVKKATINYVLYYFIKLWTLNEVMHVDSLTQCVVPVKQHVFSNDDKIFLGCEFLIYWCSQATKPTCRQLGDLNIGIKFWPPSDFTWK